jgi:hypothetical protein
VSADAPVSSFAKSCFSLAHVAVACNHIEHTINVLLLFNWLPARQTGVLHRMLLLYQRYMLC